MLIETVVREGDCYERDYLGMSEIDLGYFTQGHVDRGKFLSAVLEKHPEVVIDTKHHGWWGRWRAYKLEMKDPIYGWPLGHPNDWEPHIPTASEVVYTYWRKRNGTFMRAKPSSRGAFAVTYLPVEMDGSLSVGYELSDIWDSQRAGWTNHFYPQFISS